MPITRCPYCDMDFGNDDGLFILPVEPYSAGTLFDEEDHRKGRDAEHQSRLRLGIVVENTYPHSIFCVCSLRRAYIGLVDLIDCFRLRVLVARQRQGLS